MYLEVRTKRIWIQMWNNNSRLRRTFY